jgi:class 3 adenylate cyclase
MNEELGDKVGIAINFENIGNVYDDQSNYPEALQYYFKSLKINEELGDKRGIASNLDNIGILYRNQSNYPEALQYYFKALKINEELGNKSGIASNLGNIGKLYIKLSQDTIFNQIQERNEFIGLTKQSNLALGIDYLLKAAEISEEIGTTHQLIHWYNDLYEANKRLGNYSEALKYHELFKQAQDSVFNNEKAKEFATLEAKRGKEVAEKQIEIQRLQLLKARNESYLLYGGLAFLAVIIFIFYRERRKSEKLLLNILPAKISKRLKRKEKRIAEHFSEASIVFIDVVEFTKMSSNSEPEEIVELLNEIFTEFDALARKYGLEKIKTIGDCYMAVAGVPEPRADHAEAASRFAIEAMNLSRAHTTHPHAGEEGLPEDSFVEKVSFRCGIDCGPVVAGVIGEHKFIYDIWGDAVNTASRMEEYGVPGKVQVTERFKATVERIPFNPPLKSEGVETVGFNFTERGEIEIKGKGSMKTWFLGNKD